MSLPLLLFGAATALLVGASASAPRPRRRSSSRPKSTRNSGPSWQRTERAACAARGLKHHGGPGRADCGKTVEVKDWDRPVDSGTILLEHAKGRRTIVAPGG